MLALVLALLAQHVTVAPDVIRIPAGQNALGVWPKFEKDPQCGATTLTVTYVVPAGGIAAGGSVAFGLAYFAAADATNPAYAVNHGWLFGPAETCSKFPFGQFQRAKAGGANYCTATSSARGISVSTLARPDRGGEVLLRVTATEAQPAGTVITATLGATKFGGRGLALSWQPGRVSVVALLDADGDGTFDPPAEPPPVVLLTGTAPTGFLVDGPVTPQVGVAARVTIRPVQGSDNFGRDPIVPVEDFAGDVVLQCSDPRAQLAPPSPLRFAPADRGVRAVRVTFATPGVQTLTATWSRPSEPPAAPVAPVVSMSNAMVVQDAASGLVVLCGDLQRHSSQGGHAAIPDADCWQDLWDERQDFGTVVEHSANPMASWRLANGTAAAFQRARDPDEREFVALPGYEWTLPGSHRHVVYRNWTGDPSLTEAEPYEGFEPVPPTFAGTVADFFKHLEGDPSDGAHLAVPHHTLWDGSHGRFDWRYDWGPEKDDRFQPIVEIYSDHGSSEVWLDPAQPADADAYPIWGSNTTDERHAANLASVRDALALGYRFGIVAGSDRHNYRACVAGLEGYARTGLGFVAAARATPLRDAVWTGLCSRRTWATTGARIYVDWRAVDGTAQGQETTLAAPRFSVEAHASGIGRADRPVFVKLRVVRDDAVVETRTLAASDVAESYADPSPLRDGRGHSYYVRLTQDDMHVAWSSPIWVLSP